MWPVNGYDVRARLRFRGPGLEDYRYVPTHLYPITLDKFSIVLFASVLHHIPDYIGTIDQILSHHLEPGGTFISFQDPLWYPSLHRQSRLLSEVAYLSWRLTQGNFRRGLRARIRRRRGIYDNSDAADATEYHVVRQGVDHQRLVEFLANRFDDVSLFPYWSTQSGLWQRMGERIGTENTFGIVARGFEIEP